MGRFRTTTAIAALMAAAAPLALAAQDRDLDRATPDGRVFSGTTGTDGEPARFTFTLRGGQAIELGAEQVDNSDPALKVVDAATDDLIAENDDSNGGLSAHVRLYSERNRRVRVEVRNASADDNSTAAPFSLVIRPSTYRPKPMVDLALGSEHKGSLAADDEQLYRLRGEAGQRWEFTAEAADGSDLDPELQLFAGSTTTGEAVASDDDGGGGLNSRLRFTVPETGDYVLRVHGVGTASGDYSLTAAAGRPVEPARVETIELGAPVSAAIDDDVRERFYRLSDAAKAALLADPGPVTVAMSFVGEEEGALDPVVAVGFETPLGFSAALSDDDGAGGTNARLTLDASQLTATWLDALRIKASGFLETSGDYALSISPAAASGEATISE